MPSRLNSELPASLNDWLRTTPPHQRMTMLEQPVSHSDTTSENVADTERD